jgi:hypothetical protein
MEVFFMDDIDGFVVDFCKESMAVLEYFDTKTRENLENSEFKDFYKYDIKGIGVRSITELILKFLIFSSLCKSYQLWPETSQFYKDRKILDLALFKRKIENWEMEDENVLPEIAIEFTWGSLIKTGEFNSWSLQNIIDDILKLHKFCLVENKFILQFMILDDDIEFSDEELLNQVNSSIDKRKFRNGCLALLYDDYFKTQGSDKSVKRKFYILLWKIA